MVFAEFGSFNNRPFLVSEKKAIKKKTALLQSNHIQIWYIILHIYTASPVQLDIFSKISLVPLSALILLRLSTGDLHSINEVSKASFKFKELLSFSTTLHPYANRFASSLARSELFQILKPISKLFSVFALSSMMIHFSWIPSGSCSCTNLWAVLNSHTCHIKCLHTFIYLLIIHHHHQQAMLPFYSSYMCTQQDFPYI